MGGFLMDTQTFTIVLVVIFIIFVLFLEFEKRTIFKKLRYYLATNDFDAYYKTINSMLTKYLYPKYNRLYMTLNGYLFQKNYSEAQKLFEEMLSMHVNKKQRKDLVLKAFNYYIERKDKDHAKAMLEEIDTWDADTQKEEAHRMYDIFILKKYSYIEEMEEQLKNASDFNKGMLAYLLSAQYENKGDMEKSKEYLKASQDQMIHALKGKTKQVENTSDTQTN